MEETLKELRLALKSLGLEHLARYVSDLYESVDKVHVAFVGEYNAGKSSLINTLLGEKVVAERDLPTTNRVVLITHCPVEKREKPDDYTELVCVKNEKLKQTVLVDTPGLSSAVKEHEEALLKYLHKADLIVIVAPSNQPYTKALEGLLKILARKHSTQLAYVINIFEDPSVYEEDPDKLKRLKEFVREKLRNILSSEDVERMPIFAFSVRAVRKGASEYPFLTEEWEDFRRFIFEDVINHARRIKFNAVKEKILKLLSGSSELESLTLRVEKLKSELEELKRLKENAERFIEEEKIKRVKRLEELLEGFFGHLETVVDEHIKRLPATEVAADAKAVLKELEERITEFGERSEVLKNLESLLDYRPILVKLKKVYPELRVEPTIPARLGEAVGELEDAVYAAVRRLYGTGNAAKGFAVFFGMTLVFGLVFGLFSQSGGWKIFGWVVTALSAVGLLASTFSLLTAKGRLEKNLKNSLERLKGEYKTRLVSLFTGKLEERFDYTLNHLEAEIERVRKELESLKEKLERLKGAWEKLERG